jgi:hypothetical protein
MTNGIEELLREGFDRLTADATAPAGIVSRAQGRNRRRRIASLSAATAGTAVAAAVAVIIITVVAPRSSPAPQVQTIAYVTNRAQQALSAVAQANAIEEVRATARSGTFGFIVLNMALSKEPNPIGSAVHPGVLGSVRAVRMTSWLYRGLMVQQGFSATGKLVFTSSIGTVTSATGKHVPEAYGAAYPVRTRWRSPFTGPNGNLPKLTCANAFPGPDTPNLRATILKALSCNLLALDGHQRVDGVNAIKLIMKPPPGLPVRETLWLDPSTYLPLRTSAASPGSHGQLSVLVQYYQWLPPTTANLAALHAAIHHPTIPSGFRKLPPTDLPLAGFSTTTASQP